MKMTTTMALTLMMTMTDDCRHNESDDAIILLAVVLLLASLTLVGVGVAALTRGVQILNPEALQATSNAP